MTTFRYVYIIASSIHPIRAIETVTSYHKGFRKMNSIFQKEDKSEYNYLKKGEEGILRKDTGANSERYLLRKVFYRENR